MLRAGDACLASPNKPVTSSTPFVVDQLSVPTAANPDLSLDGDCTLGPPLSNLSVPLCTYAWVGGYTLTTATGTPMESFGVSQGLYPGEIPYEVSCCPHLR